MNRESVIKALIDWNFWYKEQFVGIPREDYVDLLTQYLKSNMVVNIAGVKRSGKSTIINQTVKRLIEEKGVNPFDTLIVNFEDPRFEVNDSKDLFTLIEIYKEIRKSNGKPYIFLDEVQKVKGWEGFVRSLIDRKEAYVVVTGSTGKLLNISKILSGRHISLEVFPLSFKEFLSFKGVKIKDELDVIANESVIKNLFLEYLKFGGFPAVVLSEVKDKLLLSLYNDIISKDVIEECKIKNEEELKALSLFYISNVGNKITFRRVSRSLNIPIKNVLRYTKCLNEAYLVFFLNPLSPKLSEMVKSEKKVYAIDQGLANVVGYRLNENLGSLLENAIFLELYRRYKDKLFYYRGDKGEVDFVINEIGNRKAYQVTFSLTDLDRELKGLKEIMEKGKDITPCILTFDDEKEIEIHGMKVKVLKAWKWLLGLYKEVNC